MLSQSYKFASYHTPNRKKNATLFVFEYFRQHILLTQLYLNRGIKHDLPFINIRKVPREVLKTEGEARGFQSSGGTLRMLMNGKIMLDRYYCINSTKALRKWRIRGVFQKYAEKSHNFTSAAWILLKFMDMIP